MKQLSVPLTRNLKRIICGGLAVLLFCMTSAPYAFADSVDPTTPSASASCTPVAATPGIQRPTGSDASTYTLNSCTGLWENQYYTWSPATKQYTPKTPYVYTCDTSVWNWKYSKWMYNAASGAYINTPLTTTQLPAGAVIADGSPTTCTPPPAPATPTGSNDPAGSASTSNGSSTNASASSSTTTVTVGNQITSTGTTGNAGLLGNTTAGNAASGNATVTANVINNVASSSSLSGGNVVTFTANIDGDVQGDLIIDPNQIQPASDGSSLTSDGNVTINSQTTGAITNNVTLAAASGDASAANNTIAGNVSTGNADAIADVINILNSVVSAGKSFVGVININGSLHGNILMPQSFLDKLLATNAPQTTMSISAADAATLGISNTVNSTATTGSATADNNTTTGNVGSGNASTAVTIFNLTGSQIVGSNCLLVFVNVTGQWVGVIMNAPAGTSAAALGGGATDTPVNGSINATTNDSITNNITVGATSGDASAANNTKVGNVSSGDASTVVNLLNLNNTQLNLSGWFGVLFINVFGSWFGNFGVYTPPAPTTGAGSDTTHTTHVNIQKPAFSFVPHAMNVPVASSAADTSFATVGAKFASAAGQTLGASAHAISKHLQATPAATSRKGNPLELVGGLLIAFGLTSWTMERVVSIRRSRPTLRVQ